MQIEEILKSLRIVASWELIEKHEYTKSEVAKILGITPATVSHYSSGKRGSDLAEKIRSFRKTYKIAAELAETLSEDYRKGRNLVNVRNLMPENLNAFELMNRKNVLMEVKTLEKYGK